MDKPVSKGLQITFLAHAILSLVFGLALLLVPGRSLSFLVWVPEWVQLPDSDLSIPGGTFIDPLITTLVIIFLLLYMNFESTAKTLIVLLSVPFAMVGAVWYLYLLGYNLSVAVWVGLIALAGVAAETGIVMIVYLDEVYERRLRAGSMATMHDLYEAIVEGAAQRVRPKMMTVASTIIGLAPIMWSIGTGSDVMKRVAAPVIGGMVTSTVLPLLVIPVVYALWRGWRMERPRQR